MMKAGRVYLVAVIILLITILTFIAYLVFNSFFNSDSTKSDLSDLIVINVTSEINQADKNVSLFIRIKNIGGKISDNSVTKVSAGSVVFLIDTLPISQGEIESLPKIYYFQPANTTYSVKITADVDREVNETDENNNNYELEIVMP
jgi:hypothetical protein